MKTQSVHGHPLYRRWTHIRACMINAQYRKNNHIEDDVNDCEWTDFWSFAEDIEAVLGPPPTDKHVLNRKNTNKGWRLSNLRWTTRQGVGRGQRTTIQIKYKGKTQCLTEWCEELNISYWTARRQYNQGYKIKDIFRASK